jgi:hypothetical protein
MNTECFWQNEYLCDDESIQAGFCNVNATGEFILAPNATELSKNVIWTQAIHLKDPSLPINYGIKNTGYYCVGTSAFSPLDAQYSALVEFRNAYGELPAAQIAKLPFYGGITIVYAVIGAYVEHFEKPLLYVLISYRFWAFLYVQHRHDICKSSDTKTLPNHLHTSLSTGTKLYHCNHYLPDSGNAYDLGILWFVFYS